METIKIKATNTTLTPSIINYVESKLGRDILGKFSGHTKILEVSVDIGKTTEHHTHGEIFRAEVNVQVKGNVLRAVSNKEDLYSAIDDVRDEIIEVLRDSKEKKDALWRRGARKIKDILKWGRNSE
jgi:ribosomal subunit interface protein